MAKYHTFPTLYDEVLPISVSKLKEWEYLQPDQYRTGNVTWNSAGRETVSIGIVINMNERYLELNYSYSKEPRKYRIELVAVLSNLGRGIVWFFRCPHTLKLCRKLYMIGGVFLHRTAFEGCMYDIQTKSKQWREQEKYFNLIFRPDKLYEELTKSYFKTSYAGKPTKRYQKIMQQIRLAESIPRQTVEQLFCLKGTNYNFAGRK
jgi:hypothetical protein